MLRIIDYSIHKIYFSPKTTLPYAIFVVQVLPVPLQYSGSQNCFVSTGVSWRYLSSTYNMGKRQYLKSRNNELQTVVRGRSSPNSCRRRPFCKVRRRLRRRRGAGRWDEKDSQHQPTTDSQIHNAERDSQFFYDLVDCDRLSFKGS